MKILIYFSLLLSTTAFALTDESTYKKSIENSEKILDWLDSHKKDFAACVPTKTVENITLCDGTEIKIKDLQKLFKMKPDELIEFINKQKIKLEILCKDDRGTTFKNWCSSNQDRKFFKEVTSLHGQYIPNENTIALHSDSNFGSLIHEYLHYLQFKNKNKKFSHQYKKERVKIQNDVVKSFDLLILDIQELEKTKKTSEAKSLIKYATGLSGVLMKFGFWQKLIDERNLFLLYINYSKDLGVAEEDVALAIKNMGFLCHDKDISPLLNKDECPN